MKVFVLCNSDILAFPTLSALDQKGMLSGVGMLKKNMVLLKPAYDALGLDVNFYSLEREGWIDSLKEVLVNLEVETVWVLTFPWKIPDELLSIPSKSFVNFHFGILPKYKGIDPIFWQLKNREKFGGLTIHLMNERIDEGPVLLQEKIPTMVGENYGLHCQRLGQFAPTLISKVVTLQIECTPLSLETPDRYFDKRPSDGQLSIDWKQDTSEDIEWLVNAANPKYQGVRTRVDGIEMRILEVTPVNMEGELEASPGQIVHADATYGLVVCCADKECLRITVVSTPIGYFSGVKLFNLGIGVGKFFK